MGSTARRSGEECGGDSSADCVDSIDETENDCDDVIVALVLKLIRPFV